MGLSTEIKASGWQWEKKRALRERESFPAMPALPTSLFRSSKES